VTSADIVEKKLILEQTNSEAEKIVNSNHNNYGDTNIHTNIKWYSTFMDVAINKGMTWISTEASRVDSLIIRGMLTLEKLDEFTVRRNVLTAFNSDK